MSGGVCWSCGQKLEASDYSRQSTCSECGRDTRVCKGCEFYDPASYQECREPVSDRVVDKERANFCDYFRPSSKSGERENLRQKQLQAAEALFRKKS